MKLFQKALRKTKFLLLQSLNAVAAIILIIVAIPFFTVGVVTLLVLATMSRVAHYLSVGAFMYREDLDDEFNRGL